MPKPEYCACRIIDPYLSRFLCIKSITAKKGVARGSVPSLYGPSYRTMLQYPAAQSQGELVPRCTSVVMDAPFKRNERRFDVSGFL